MWSIHRADGSVAAGWMLMPLRLFLGVTFLFAGAQKLANPAFFHSSSPISIHAQLAGAARTSPIHGLLTHLVPIAPVVGAAIAVGEVAIGIGALLGLLTRVAAVGGMALSLGLFLSVSYHSSPYYTGSDIVFLFAWTPLALAGAAGAPALDTWLAGPPASAADRTGGIPRREVLSRGAVTGIVAGAVLILGGAVAGIGRALGGTSSPAADSNSLSNSGPTASTTTGSAAGAMGTTTTTATTQAAPSGTKVGRASSVPVGGSASFTDPGSGDPALVIQEPAGHFTAFDAVCPHAGCTVSYVASAKIIACPCHGSEFDPTTGDVLRGPAAHALGHISMVEGPNGDLYVQ